MTYDFLIIGAGIFGISTAIELRKRNHSVAILNPDQIPNPLAASTDISKVVRMEYGSDTEYMKMAIKSMEGWREWNEILDETIYHEVGYILATKTRMTDPDHNYEWASYQNLLAIGKKPERLSASDYANRFPAFHQQAFTDGFYHAEGGFAESGKAVKLLAKYARSIGVDVFENSTVEKIITKQNEVQGVTTREGARLNAGHMIVCAGNFTPYLIPELKPFMKITGHPVFHLKPSKPELFKPPNFAVFAADISNSGWYGFPFHPTENVVKVALHTEGLELHPEFDERIVTEEDHKKLRSFLKSMIPSLANDPVVYTRRCCYTDTLDGHFWIDNHPVTKGLTVGSGGSGHGFKMGPVVGKMIADIAENGTHEWSDRYKWRSLSGNTIQSEEARFLQQRKL